SPRRNQANGISPLSFPDGRFHPAAGCRNCRYVRLSRLDVATGHGPPGRLTEVAPFSHARRALLRGSLQSRPPMRPPWALGEPGFLDAWTRCGDCIAACPEHVLVRAAGRFPAFDPTLGECVFCEACVEVCAPRALDKAEVQPA